MPRLQHLVWSLAAVAALSVPARAHFPWIVLTPEERPAQAAVYFGESAGPDDPELLDKIAHAEVQLLSGWRGEPQRLELKKGEDALVAVLVDKPELLPLEVTPRLDWRQLVLHVAWQGQPAAAVEVNIGGPGLSDNLAGTTDDAGDFRCELPESGLYSIRARLVEPAAGEHNGQTYDEARHYSTLTLNYAAPAITTAENSWPELPRGMTSFGAAVAGDWLYVYGGHLGAAHSYSMDEQSGEFMRLNLAQPTGWEQLPGGPKLTGLTMVAHGGKLYRIGGFAALNREGEDDKLVSQADVARFNPQTMQWESLPPLPAGRSSLDAAVIGDTLYVVGGWNLQGDAESQWHDSALMLDLSAAQPQWREIASPGFQRRAVSLAAWQGKLYVIGGMQPEGGATTRTDVYDPATDSWSAGPQLRGGAMDGFGTSSFATPERLTATTMSGAIQELSAAGTWEFAGQLAQPRFFHRMLPWRSDLVIVGGASMADGKRLALERIPGR
jgi:N-acetylneuraminic acid mutarotase